MDWLTSKISSPLFKIPLRPTGPRGKIDLKRCDQFSYTCFTTFQRYSTSIFYQRWWILFELSLSNKWSQGRLRCIQFFSILAKKLGRIRILLDFPQLFEENVEGFDLRNPRKAEDIFSFHPDLEKSWPSSKKCILSRSCPVPICVGIISPLRYLAHGCTKCSQKMEPYLLSYCWKCLKTCHFISCSRKLDAIKIV